MIFIDWILENIPDRSRVLELGSGPTTAILCDHYEVTSIEHDGKYVALCDPRSKCVHAPLVNGWYDPAIVEDAAAGAFDLILVDGPPQSARGAITRNFDLFDWNCWSVWDDINRPADMAAFAAAQRKLGGARVITIHAGEAKSFGVIHPLH